MRAGWRKWWNFSPDENFCLSLSLSLSPSLPPSLHVCVCIHVLKSKRLIINNYLSLLPPLSMVVTHTLILSILFKCAPSPTCERKRVRERERERERGRERGRGAYPLTLNFSFSFSLYARVHACIALEVTLKKLLVHFLSPLPHTHIHTHHYSTVVAVNGNPSQAANLESLGANRK